MSTFTNKKLIERIRIELLESQRTRAIQALEKGELVEGDAKEELVEVLSRKFDKKFVILVSNGFAAIFISLVARFGGEPKTIVTAAASTCFAMVHAIKASGSKPVFADLDMRSASPGSSQLEAISEHFDAAVIPNHFGLISSCNRSGLANHFLIEDAAQSFTSSYISENNADVTILSFYPTKIVNGIDGGVLLTDNEEIFMKASKLVSYQDQHNFEEQTRYNLKLNNINAAYALGTLDHLEEIEKSMNLSYKILSTALQQKNMEVLTPEKNELPTKLILKFASLEERDFALNYFQSNGISASRELIWVTPGAEKNAGSAGTSVLIDTTLSLPYHPYLKEIEIKNILEMIHAYES